MAAAEWWCWPLPSWLGSGAAWFVFLNVVVGAIFALSSRAQPPSTRGGITRRASSAVLQRIRSFSLFSFPSSPFTTAAATALRETDQEARGSAPSTPRSPPAAAEPSPEKEEDEGVEDANSMSMEEAYALVLAGRQQPPPTEDEAARARSDVDAKAEEFIRGFKEDLRQQRLHSIFNYTQMLRQRVAGARRPPDPDCDR
ncbi:uncharacterized protein LOC100837012 isoform X2 [Brachypodium distachyon]|uniref:DUF4408 domain-containing protein n=1 Tax=Brachypodium distachyon TaxID=15368 RepID=A0A0Q3H9K7_BRADI|nr:uncharacterized protein LOC100837012 isoform X2 [Brachypodium distachyon]KQJ90002.1 hypothetical protein BRADI_4g28900v3 [Brachypodium distachyon]|eukprot:XP_014757691.1 uncharacterized protein LOC100837012 isoform X2 [Brachypodium distachyon]